MAVVEKEVANTNNTWYTDLSDKVESNKYIFDEYFSKDFVSEINKNVMAGLNKIYFRPRFIGFDDYPERNSPDTPLIFASNHSGMAFPWDAIIMASNVFAKYNFDKRCLRPLSSPMLSKSTLMNPFLCDNLWHRSGAVDATFLNFETMMNQNEYNLLIYPEGVPGIGKGFNKRYQLQRFSSSFITMALKYKTDIVPVYTVNGEFINPYAYTSQRVNKLVNKVGIPYLPLGFITPVLLLAPWFFYAAFPAKLTYVLGERIPVSEWTDKSIENLTKQELVEIKEKVHLQMQEGLLKAVNAFGRRPFELSTFFKRLIANIRHLPYSIPLGWPLLFSEFMDRYENKKEGKVIMRLGFLSSVRIFFSRWRHLYLYLPILGWIPLLLAAYRDFNMKRRDKVKKKT